MFSIGDAVCYPMHGVGIIEDTCIQSPLGTTAEYYMLRFDNGRLTTMVPVDGAEKLGIRKVLSKDDCQKMFDYISNAKQIKFSSDWNMRRNAITELLHSGKPEDMIDVIISLNSRSGYRGLSTSEHRIVSAATKTLVSEINTVLGYDEEVVLGAINARLTELKSPNK